MNKLNLLLDIVIYLTVGIGLIFAITFIYFKKFNKRKLKNNTNVDYSNIRRKDSSCFVPSDDIKQDIIITDEYTRFIAAFKTYGTDYDASNIRDCLAKANGYASFINILDKPIQKRIYCKNYDIEDSIIEHQQILINLDKKLEAKLNELSNYVKNEEHLVNEYEKKVLVEKIVSLNQEIENDIWMIKHTHHVIEYMKEVSGPSVDPSRDDTYIVDWTYEQGAYDVEISNEEKLRQASEYLKGKEDQFTAALSNAGVRIVRMRTEELEEMIRIHNQPIKANIFKGSDIQKTNYEDKLVTSDSIEQLEIEYHNILDNELLSKFMSKEFAS